MRRIKNCHIPFFAWANFKTVIDEMIIILHKKERKHAIDDQLKSTQAGMRWNNINPIRIYKKGVSLFGHFKRGSAKLLRQSPQPPRKRDRKQRSREPAHVRLLQKCLINFPDFAIIKFAW